MQKLIHILFLLRNIELFLNNKLFQINPAPTHPPTHSHPHSFGIFGISIYIYEAPYIHSMHNIHAPACLYVREVNIHISRIRLYKGRI